MDVEVTINNHTDAYLMHLLELDAVVARAAKDVRAQAITAIKTGKKTGRIYLRRRKGKAGQRKGMRAFIKHQASAPGEAPATDTGTLANSIYTSQEDELEYSVTVGAEYGAVLEEELDRPFLQPALDAVEPGFREAVKRVIDGGSS